ncbi:hypothetical protein CV944_09665 [Geobacillus sp. WSUCF-018B]|nr:hypothetical protein CV944_09665 [Geobacillus sp. WSUCF-018B]
MAMRFVIIDLETTGNGPKKGDRIIQLGMAVVEGRSIVARFASFFNPEQPIPPFIQQLTNFRRRFATRNRLRSLCRRTCRSLPLFRSRRMPRRQRRPSQRSPGASAGGCLCCFHRTNC